MNFTRRIRVLIGCALVAVAPGWAQTVKAPAAFSVTRFQSAIDGFLAADKTSPPPKNGILFIGSSIFREWTTLTAQMAPLPVFNRAFGGSRTAEVLHYTDAIVLPYAPRLIVYYCGSNDLNAEVLPPEIAANFRAFVDRVHTKLPQTRIVFASIIRAPQKQEHWDRVDEANALIKKFCATDSRLGFADLNPAVFDATGRPRLDLYREDKLHYHPPAYVEFSKILKPVVAAVWAEASAEPPPAR